jgi:LmbE family N-acetylglucosaminyl deacetylase
MKRLLCVFAHPDDECLGPGGTIARCALEGGDVFVTTFTAGEAGTIGISKTLARDELARRRRIELADACAELGVHGHRILGAPDGGVSAVDPAWAVREILSDIRRFRPHVALTFHRRGVSAHPDHIAVAAFLDRAIMEAGDEGPRACYEWGISRARAPLYQRPNLVPLEDDEIAAVVDIDDAAMDRKLAAIRRHETQAQFLVDMESRFDFRAMSRPEYFARGRARLDFAGAPVNDIFAEIDTD